MRLGPGPAGETHLRGFEARDPRTGLSRREHARGLLGGGRLLALESGRALRTTHRVTAGRAHFGPDSAVDTG